VVQRSVRAPIWVTPIGWRRRLGAALLAGAAVLTFACVMALFGAWRDDAAIDARTGRVTAEVVSSTFGRTIIRFATPDGVVHSPQRGVLYPRGLEQGQLVRVEYDLANPELVRVADRGFELGVLPIAIAVAGIWLVLTPPALWLRRRPGSAVTALGSVTVPKAAAGSGGPAVAACFVTLEPKMGGEL
jgi:hypothetical protein